MTIGLVSFKAICWSRGCEAVGRLLDLGGNLGRLSAATTSAAAAALGLSA